MPAKLSVKNRVLLGLSLTAVVIVLLHGPIAQDVSYHGFADRRQLLAVPNFWNVISNLPFLMIGFAGMLFSITYKRRLILSKNVFVFFMSIALTGIGSGYYHLHPTNATLVWDRLPMTISFMSFFSIVIGDRVNKRAGQHLLLPLILTGLMSILYWQMTEGKGQGDLRFYVIVQFLPMLLIPVILLWFRETKTPLLYFWLISFTYATAKICEAGDVMIFNATNMISGHTLKHFAAALGPLLLLIALINQKLLSPEKVAEVNSKD